MRAAHVILTSSLVLLAACVLSLPLLPMGAQVNEAEATVIDHNSYIDWESLSKGEEVYEGNFFHVVGVIQDTGTKNIKDVGVELTFYDAQGEKILAGPVHGSLGFYRIEDGVEIPENLLGPGDKLPFRTVLLDAEASAKVANYDISVKYAVTDEEPYRNLVILNHRLRSRYGSASVIGELMNSGDQHLSCVSIYAAFYDGAGRIVDAAYYPAPLYILVPGEKIAFATYSASIEGNVTYELTTTCLKTRSTPYREFEILAHTSRTDQYGYLVLEGEVANTGDQDATEVRVAADFYDEDGMPLGGYYTEIPQIRAGERSPFEVVLWDEELAAEVANYTFHISSSESTYIRQPSQIACSVSPRKITAGQAITISGAVTPAIKGVKITLTFTSPNGTTITEETLSDSNGSFTHLFNAQEEGDWAVEVSWPGNNMYEGSTSSPAEFTVERAAAPPSLVRATPSLETASAAVAVGAGVTVGVTAVMSATGLGQQINAAVSGLKIPNPVKDFLKFYAEKTFKKLTSEEVVARKRRRLVSATELLSLTLSALILLLIFSYIEVHGLPSFTDPASLLSVLPHVMITVVFVFVLSQLFAFTTAAALDVWCQFKIWLYGLIALTVSGLGFLLPFGSPGRTDYEGELDERKAGLAATLKILSTLTLTLPFYVFLILGYKIIGDSGLLIATMSAFYSAFPFKPLEGQAVYKYNKPLWLTGFVGTFILFTSATFDAFPHTIYLFAGLLAAALFITTLAVTRRRRTVPLAIQSPLG